MEILEKNTELFYKELNNQCNPEILLKIAQNGIYLYEPLFNYNKIKDHEYIVEISLLASQFFRIDNIKQYNKFLDFCKNNTIKILPDNKCDTRYIFNLLIINEYLLKQILNEKDIKIIQMFLYYLNFEYISTLSCLYKYNFITVELYNLFSKKNFFTSCKFEIFEFLNYDNNILLEKIANSRNSFNLFEKIYFYDCRDVKLLKYLSENFTDITKLNDSINNFKCPLLFPYNILKKYANIFYKTNKLYVKCNDKYSEDFINTVFTDKAIDFFIKYKSMILIKPDLLKRYNISYDDSLNYRITNNLKYNKEIDNNTKKEDFDNRSLYRLSEEYIKLKDFNNFHKLNKYNIAFTGELNSVNLYELNFVKNCLLNKDELDKILNDIYYLFNSKFDTDNYTEHYLIQLTCIISLLHNNYNKTLIKFLLKNIEYTELHGDKLAYSIYNSYYIDDNANNVERIFGLLCNTPNKIFNSYIGF